GIGEPIRRRLAAWAATVLNQATAARPNMPKGVEDRDADMWESLLAIADRSACSGYCRSRTELRDPTVVRPAECLRQCRADDNSHHPRRLTRHQGSTLVGPEGQTPQRPWVGRPPASIRGALQRPQRRRRYTAQGLPAKTCTMPGKPISPLRPHHLTKALRALRTLLSPIFKGRKQQM